MLHDRLRRLKLRNPKRSYRELHAAGISEHDLLQLLLVPHEQASTVAVSCGKPASSALADRVVERNRIILDLFPRGMLRAMFEKARPECDYWYARREDAESTWILVDETAMKRRINARHSDPAAAHEFAENALGRRWSDIQSAIAQLGNAEIPNTIAFKRWRVCQDAPPLAFDEDCWQDGIGRELFGKKHYPLIPPGHLLFSIAERRSIQEK